MVRTEGGSGVDDYRPAPPGAAGAQAPSSPRPARGESIEGSCVSDVSDPDNWLGFIRSDPRADLLLKPLGGRMQSSGPL